MFALLALMTLPLLNRACRGGGKRAGRHADARRSGGGCLLPPTILMGASLPAIVGCLIKGTPSGIACGGATRTAATRWSGDRMPPGGLLLIAEFRYDHRDPGRRGDESGRCGAGVGCGAAHGARRSEEQLAAESAAPDGCRSARELCGLTIACRGFGGAGRKWWTPLLGYLLLGTVCVFAIILAVFLAGLPSGSAGGSRLPDARAAGDGRGGWCQALLALAIVWTRRSSSRFYRSGR